MSFRFVPRSAVFGQTTVEPDGSMPQARMMDPRAGRPGTQAQGAMPAVQAVALLKGQLVKVHADRARIVKEANAKLGALVARVRQLEGALRVAYSPNAGTPGQGQVDQGVPTHALRNPNVYTTAGGRGAPPAQPLYDAAGNPGDAAGNPDSGAQSVHETVRAAEDAIFYGRGDSAFYEGGEND